MEFYAVKLDDPMCYTYTVVSFLLIIKGKKVLPCPSTKKNYTRKAKTAKNKNLKNSFGF